MAYTHTNAKGTQYFLHSTQVVLKGSKKNQTIYFFARKVRKNALDSIPEGFKIKENPRTGLPILKKK